MTTPKASLHRAIATLKMPRKVAALIQYAQAILKAMTNNPHFASPNPTLVALTDAMNELQAAETAAEGRAKGGVAARNAKRTAFIRLLEQLKAYVQTVADADVENGGAIIQSAGLAVRKTVVHAARGFAAKQGTVSGAVKVFAVSAGHRAAYDWQYSLDGGKTWVAAAGTLQAKTTVTGLPPGTTVQFRYKARTKSGEGDWSAPVALLVK
jgi:hypothetical protein